MRCFTILAWLSAMSIATAQAQCVLTGRMLHPRFPGAAEQTPISAVLVFASLPGDRHEPLSFRTWETDPAGWYRMSGPAGNYTIVFSEPAHFARSRVLTNQFMRPGEMLDQVVSPRFDVACMDASSWDESPASRYFQPFVAQGQSLTHVGFKLAHDGVDGFGPKSQNLVLSIHRRSDGTPDTWPQVGPSLTVVEVDCGGAKDRSFSAGWNSGEVPLEPGETYAVQLRAQIDGNAFQAFWRKAADPVVDCYRLGRTGKKGFTGKQLWMTVATDADGLLIPYNKRVHRQFNELTDCIRKWSQTYVAQGHGLTSVIVYAAVSGAQPPLSRQRLRVRVREGGPAGKVVGVEKIAVGNGNYTGDASWGAFGLAYAPGEVPLKPGTTYAIEWESIETQETLDGFVNIKGQVSDGRPGFNPYKKHPLDRYEHGTAYRHGTESMNFDLDMQVIEYAQPPDGNWSSAVVGDNLLRNGDLQAGAFDATNPDAIKADDWKPFALRAATAHQDLEESGDPKNRILRIGPPKQPQPVDGGFVQCVEGLNRLDTYRLFARTRVSWPLDSQRQCSIGIDPTGQTDDPSAESIRWYVQPGPHGIWQTFVSEPIRPASDRISIWLRGRCDDTPPWPYHADFDALDLRRLHTNVPTNIGLSKIESQ